MLDLPYAEDSRAEVDMNVVMTGVGPLRRGAGHGRGDGVHPGRAGRAARPGRDGHHGADRPAGGRAGRAAARGGERSPPRCGSCWRRPTPTRWPRSSPSCRRPPTSSWSPPADVPDVVEDGDTLEDNARLKAARSSRRRGGRGGRRHRARGRCPRRRARACTRPDTPARTRPTPTTWPSCCAELAARRRGGARAGPVPDGGAGGLPRRLASCGPKACVEGIAPTPRGEQRLRLRPGLRARRRRRADLRRDDDGREARRVAPGAGVPGPGRACWAERAAPG